MDDFVTAAPRGWLSPQASVFGQAGKAAQTWEAVRPLEKQNHKHKQNQENSMAKANVAAKTKDAAEGNSLLAASCTALFQYAHFVATSRALYRLRRSGFSGGVIRYAPLALTTLAFTAARAPELTLARSIWQRRRSRQRFSESARQSGRLAKFCIAGRA